MEPDPRTVHARVEEGIARLRSLREGDLAVPELAACGQAAVEPLRAFLFARDPSGIFLPRCQAVEALAALGAREVLTDFLAHPPEVSDPVEQAGVDAVTSAVARALLRWPDDRLFALLLERAKERLLPGVVEALGHFGREEAVPVLSAALAEDFCRSGAESGLRRLGARICPHLLQLAQLRLPSPGRETEMSRRRRRSALRLWAELRRSGDLPDAVCSLTQDADDHVAFQACALCVAQVSPAGGQRLAGRIVDLLYTGDVALRADVEDLLIEHYAICRPAVEASLPQAREPAAAALRYVMARAAAADA